MSLYLYVGLWDIVDQWLLQQIIMCPQFRKTIIPQASYGQAQWQHFGPCQSVLEGCFRGCQAAVEANRGFRGSTSGRRSLQTHLANVQAVSTNSCDVNSWERSCLSVEHDCWQGDGNSKSPLLDDLAYIIYRPFTYVPAWQTDQAPHTRLLVLFWSTSLHTAIASWCCARNWATALVYGDLLLLQITGRGNGPQIIMGDCCQPDLYCRIRGGHQSGHRAPDLCQWWWSCLRRLLVGGTFAHFGCGSCLLSKILREGLCQAANVASHYGALAATVHHHA